MAGTNETIKEQLLKQFAQLENDRSSFDPHWRDLTDFINPRGSRFLTSEVNRGATPKSLTQRRPWQTGHCPAA